MGGLLKYNYIITMDKNNFWGRVKPLIKAHNMTQEQFAKRLGLSIHTVRNWIYYNRVPDLAAAHGIAYTLGVTLDYLLGGKDNEMTELRLREIESRKAADRIYDMTMQIQEQLLLIHPLTGERGKKAKK